MDYSYIPIPEDAGMHLIDRCFIISVDLGQSIDYTAISIIENSIVAPGFRNEHIAYLRHIERMKDMSYPSIVGRISEIYHSPALQRTSKAVVIDLTGVGRPVYDLMREAGFRQSLNAISITGGNDTNVLNGRYNVPKTELITSMQIMLQNGELKIASGLREAKTLIEEMANFETRISDSGRTTFGGHGVHDDIVMSVAMGCWLSQRRHYRMSGDDVM